MKPVPTSNNLARPLRAPNTEAEKNTEALCG
jgi:hypothetical protein